MMDLFKELDGAMKEHESASRQLDAARFTENEARNRLNKAQQAIDKALAATKAKAPWNTDWHSQRNPGETVSARTVSE